MPVFARPADPAEAWRKSCGSPTPAGLPAVVLTAVALRRRRHAPAPAAGSRPRPPPRPSRRS
ncbi:hypothetical protein G3I50_04640, partial [Streptomyces parvus]|nr:hypothetical protein [Streptomyces parvus]